MATGIALWNALAPSQSPGTSRLAIQQGWNTSFQHHHKAVSVTYSIRVRNLGESPGTIRCIAYVDGKKEPGSTSVRSIPPGEEIAVRGSFLLPGETLDRVLEDIEPYCEEPTR